MNVVVMAGNRFVQIVDEYLSNRSGPQEQAASQSHLNAPLIFPKMPW